MFEGRKPAPRPPPRVEPVNPAATKLKSPIELLLVLMNLKRPPMVRLWFFTCQLKSSRTTGIGTRRVCVLDPFHRDPTDR